MIQVVDNQVAQTQLPETGFINRQCISNYDLLPLEVLKGEGWLPLVEDIPIYNQDTQIIVFDKYIIEVDKVTAKYKIVNIALSVTLEE